MADEMHVRSGEAGVLAGERIPHPYISTACQHQLHWRCREECKFCKAPCLCHCHITEDDVSEDT